MKSIELVKIGEELLKLMSNNGVLRDDWRWISLYDKYFEMRHEGWKHKAAVMVLLEEYHLGERTVERIIKRLRRDC